MSSLGRPSTTIDLNTGTITAVNTIQTSVQVVQQETVDNKEYFENLIGQQGVTRDEDGEIVEQHSVKDNLETLYNMITGVAAATGQEEIAGPLIAGKELYDNFDYAYQEGDSIHDAIKKFKEYVGHPEKLPVLEERDEDGNIITEFEDGVDARGLFKIYNMLYIRDDETDETHKNLYLDNKHAGEIRFQTANALNNNDSGLYYNTKINDKGHLCYYHNTDAISLPAWTPIMVGAGENPLPVSGWYDLDSSFKACAINIALNSVGINILFAKMKALKIADTVEKTGDGVWTAVEGGYNTIKSSLAIIGGIGGGAIAGHLSALNILNQQKKANEYLEDELRKIKEEILNIDNGNERQDENEPYNEMSKIDLEYIQQQIEMQLFQGYELQQEYDIAYQKQNNFLHQDYLNNSKFQLIPSLNENEYKLISPNLDNVELKLGTPEDDMSIDTAFGKIAKNVYDIDNLENTIGTREDDKDTDTVYGYIANNYNNLEILDQNVMFKSFITDNANSKFQLTPVYDENNNIISHQLDSLLLGRIRDEVGTRNPSDTETVFEKIAKNTTDINTNTTDINTNTTDINTNKSDITDLRTDLTTQTGRIDDMRLVLGYDDNSILHLILPLNDLGETPSIEANLINNKGLLDLGYKKNDLVNNYDDYFNLFFAIPKLHSEQTITTFTENEIVNGLSPTNANISFITDYDNLKSYMTGTLNFEVSNNNLCISLFAKLSQLTEFKNLLFYNGITAFVKNDTLKINYNKEISNTYTILDNTFANGTPPLTYTDLNYYDNRYTYHISRTDDKLINYIEILDNVNMDYGDGIDIFTTTSIRGYKLTNIVDSVEIYFKHDVVIKNIDLVLKRFWTYGSGFTQTPFEVFAKLNISIRNSINDPWVQILQNDYKALGYSQYQGVTSFNISDENQSLSCRFLSISFEYNAPPLQPSHSDLELCFLNILDTHTLTEYTTGEAVLPIQNNNEYSHIVYNHSQNNKTFNFLIDGITRDFNLTDYFEVNTNQLVIGDNDLKYRMLGIGNTYHTNSQIVQEIRDLNDTSLRVNIDGLTKVDDLYVKDNLLVNKLEFINGNEVLSFAPSVEETGGRRRALISDTTYTLLDEVIIPNPPTENSFLYYDVSTANVSTRSDVVLDEDILDVVRTGDILNVVRDEDILDVVRDSDILDVVRDSDILDVVRDSDILDVVRDSDITDVVRDSDITDVVRDSDILDVVRDSDITDVVRDSDITDVVRDSDITDVVRDSDILDVVRDSELTTAISGISQYTDTKVEQYLINNDYTTNLIVDTKLLNYELKVYTQAFNITIHSLLNNQFQVTANTRDWNYSQEIVSSLTYIEGDTLFIDYGNIIYYTNNNDVYVEIYTDGTDNPNITIIDGVVSNGSTSLQINVASGNDYKIIMKKQSDNTQLSIIYLNVELNLQYVNSRFIDYALKSDIPAEFNGDYNSLDNLPTLFDGNYNSLDNLPTLFDGNYNSLDNKPTIPAPYTDTDVIDVLNEYQYIRYSHLNAGLDLKANVNHTHEISDINNLSIELANINQYSDTKVDTFLSTKNYLTSIPAEYVTDTELSTAIGEINQYSDAKVDTFLTTKNYLTSIPAEYVTDTELSTAISGKADVGHTHTTADIIYLKDTTFHMDTTTTLLGENRFGICYFGNSGNGWSIIPINTNGGGFLYNNGLKGSNAYSWQNITHYNDANVRNVLSQSAGNNLVWNTTTNKFDASGSGSGSSVSPTLENVFPLFDTQHFENSTGYIRIRDNVLSSDGSGGGGVVGNVNITDLDPPDTYDVITTEVVDTTINEEPSIVYNATSVLLQQLAEQQTGLKGWKIVRYSSNGTRFVTNDNLEGTWVYGTEGDYNATNLSQWSIEFSSGGYDQYFFANGSNTSFTFDRWLVLDKPEFEVNSSIYTNGYDQPRTAIMSSINPNTHTVKISTDTSADRPLISLTNWGVTDDNLYAEAYNYVNPGKIGSTSTTLRHYVFVRKSTDTLSLTIPQAQIPQDKYQYITLTYENAHPDYTSTTDGNQRTHTINFPENVVADILVVGGGGAGGTEYIGSGGGGGGLVYDKGIELSGTYTIKVGRGGVALSTGNEEDGRASSIIKDNVEIYTGYGGGNGGTYSTPDGASGGSGGGTTWTGGRTQDTNQAIITYSGGGATKGFPIDKSYGNKGAVYYNTGGLFYAGGGGGAGSEGYRVAGKYGWGGDGKQIDITGENKYYAAGGGGGSDYYQYAAQGGSGIGGNGASGNYDTSTNSTNNQSPNINPTSGQPMTGSGGGGGGGTQVAAGDGGGNGGSGIVIIRYYVVSSITHKYLAFTTQTTYTLNVPEDTSCDVLVINNTQAYKATGATFNGSYNVIVGSDSRIEKDDVILHNPNSALTITDDITGVSIQYTANNPIVIIRYSLGTTTTNTITTPVQPYGYLKYDETGNDWIVENNISYNLITDKPSIPTDLSQLSGTLPYSSITSTPTIPTSLSQLSGTIPYSSVTGTPTIPTNFDSRYYRKDQVYQYLAKTGLSLSWWNGTGYSYETIFEINTNYILQDAYKPAGSHNFRWLLRISGGTLGLTHWYINTFIFYDSKENIFFNDIKNGWPTANFAFSNRWGSQGDHYIRIVITTTGTEMTHLNVNIS